MSFERTLQPIQFFLSTSNSTHQSTTMYQHSSSTAIWAHPLKSKLSMWPSKPSCTSGAPLIRPLTSGIFYVTKCCTFQLQPELVLQVGPFFRRRCSLHHLASRPFPLAGSNKQTQGLWESCWVGVLDGWLFPIIFISVHECTYRTPPWYPTRFRSATYPGARNILVLLRHRYGKKAKQLHIHHFILWNQVQWPCEVPANYSLTLELEFNVPFLPGRMPDVAGDIDSSAFI